MTDDAAVGKELVDGLTKFADDLERGDLSGYRITTVRRPMNDDAAKAAEVNLIAENAQLLRDWHDALSRAESAESALADARRDRERLAAALAEFAERDCNCDVTGPKGYKCVRCKARAALAGGGGG